MIDAKALDTIPRMRLVGWVWKRQRITAVHAALKVEAGVLIDGRDCVEVEPMDEPSASLFV